MAGSFIRFFIGNMSAEKSGFLIQAVETQRQWGKKKVLVVKPDKDTRSPGLVASRGGRELKAVEIPTNSPEKIFDIIKEQERATGEKFDILAFDEVQFYSVKSKFFWTICELMKKEYDILAAGLALDFRGEPLGATLQLATLAEEKCMWLRSCCMKQGCGKPAIFPQRFLHSGDLAPYDDEDIAVGSEDRRFSRYYEPRCYECFEIPPRTDEK